MIKDYTHVQNHPTIYFKVCLERTSQFLIHD